jgi:hypothetical protein
LKPRVQRGGKEHEPRENKKGGEDKLETSGRSENEINMETNNKYRRLIKTPRIERRKK